MYLINLCKFINLLRLFRQFFEWLSKAENFSDKILKKKVIKYVQALYNKTKKIEY